MNKIIRRCTFAFGFVMMLGLLLVNRGVDARNTTENYRQAEVGGVHNMTNWYDMTINGKKVNNLPKDLKKKISVTKEVKEHGYTYVTSSYTKGQSVKAYNKMTSYSLRFKKEGKYTVKMSHYICDTYRLEAVNEQKTAYRLDTYDWKEGKYTEGSTADADLFEKKTDADGNEYFINPSGKIYAKGDEDLIAVASLNAENRLVYEPVRYYLEDYTYHFTITGYNPPIKKIALGKAKIERSGLRTVDGTNETNYKKSMFVTGKKAKLDISMGKDYSITDIVVETFDKDGKSVLTPVKNKKNIKLGNYKRKEVVQTDELEGLPVSASGMSTSMFKETWVYVFYKNKALGGYIDIKSINKKPDGGYEIEYAYLKEKNEDVVIHKTDDIDELTEYAFANSAVFYMK